MRLLDVLPALTSSTIEMEENGESKTKKENFRPTRVPWDRFPVVVPSTNRWDLALLAC